ncbi:hypothetical protein RISK_004426 [Rhodopirellula islandica]|uniref:Uncharacterized protein n=1 Tax=Rhodopirellula islandica TaxID=595434 RepID=A0A0J1EDB6_RHOIS|nr:hypothetical protein RISK_004426 [Rhodopirellula islandica]
MLDWRKSAAAASVCIGRSGSNGDDDKIDFAGSRDIGLGRALSFSRAFNETAAILSTIQAEPSP